MTSRAWLLNSIFYIFQVLCFNLSMRKEWHRSASHLSCINKTVFRRVLAKCEPNTAALSQEIITAINVPACSLAATLIGWNYFRKQHADPPRGALPEWNHPSAEPPPGDISLCQHINILLPPVSPSLCLQPIRYMSFVSFDSDLSTCAPSWVCSSVSIRIRTAWNYLTCCCYAWGWRC